jgi:4-amino-4-deoxy-L-arabinose transferase-like glycosyltransferase
MGCKSMIIAQKTRGNLLLISILIIFGLSITLYYGRMAFMPLDHSIIFDGGWRILSGQIPFRDFYTPNALTPLVLQAVFFKIFGVTWFAYCLHAAIFNGLFCVLIYTLLRLFNGSQLIAFFYALLSGVVLYPPIGTAYMEQHAFFFMTVAIVMAVITTRTHRTNLRTLLLLTLPSIVGLAYLSKQIPTIFVIPLIALILLTKLHRKKLLNATLLLVGGSLLFLGLLWLFVATYNIDISKIELYFFQLPSSTGRDRIGRLLQNWPEFFKMVDIWKLYSFGIIQVFCLICFSLIAQTIGAKNHLISKIVRAIPVLVLLILSLLSFYYFARYYTGSTRSELIFVFGLLFLYGGVSAIFISFFSPRKTKLVDVISKQGYKYLPELLFTEGFFMICLLFSVLTNNSPENGVPYIFLSLGLVHILTRDIFFIKTRAYSSQIQQKKTLLLTVITLIIATTGIMDAVRFNMAVNVTRRTHDLTYTPEVALASANNLPPALTFLLWDIPEFYKFTSANFRDLAAFLQNQSSNFLLFGDSSILYGITNKPSINPSLWFHYGLSIPFPNTKEFENYEEELIQNMKKYDVKFIVIEGQETLMGTNLADFQQLSKFIKQDYCHSNSYGSFTLLELCSDQT